MGLYGKAWEFVDAIKDTKEFKELLQAKSHIEQNSSLKSQVREFNKRLSSIYSSNNSAKVIESKASELNKQFENLSKIPEVQRFLKASKEFNTMMIKVYKTMNESVEEELRLR